MGLFSQYYKKQAKTLLTWARGDHDKAYANRLRVRAAVELEQAEKARAAVADLDPLIAEFNAQQMRR